MTRARARWLRAPRFHGRDARLLARSRTRRARSSHHTFLTRKQLTVTHARQHLNVRRPFPGESDPISNTDSDDLRVATSSAHRGEDWLGEGRMPSATMMASRVTASAVAARAAPRAARGVAARRGAGAATGSGRWSSARQATLRVSRGSAARPVRPRSPPRRDPAAFPPRFERHLAIAARVPASRRVVDPILETPSARRAARH